MLDEIKSKTWFLLNKKNLEIPKNIAFDYVY